MFRRKAAWLLWNEQPPGYFRGFMKRLDALPLLRSLVFPPNCRGGSVSSWNKEVITIFIINSVMHAFWLVLTYDLLEDRRIDDVIIKTFFSVYLNSLLHKTNRFQVAVHLFSNRSQRTSKCGKNISDTLGCTSCATFLFLPHFDIICDLLLNRHTTTWNQFVNYIKKKLNVKGDIIFVSVLQ